jgi:hypothetical protein
MKEVVRQFKYRPEVKSIEDLQPGDEFLVGDGRWPWCTWLRDSGITLMSDNEALVEKLIRANVPIERDIPYPEGGAEKWELRESIPSQCVDEGALAWNGKAWVPAYVVLYDLDFYKGFIQAIPKAKPAPKEYTVRTTPCGCIRDLEPLTDYTVQRVSEQGEPR